VEINANTQPGWTGSAPSIVSGDLDPTVVVENQPPASDPGGTYSGTVGVDVIFDGSGSSDPDGTIQFYDWDFGDGTMDFGAGPVPSHTYTATNEYQVTLTDDAGDMASDTTTATIGSGTLAPLADANGPYSADIGTELTFDGTGSSDPDGSIVSYNWNFGDGTTLDDGGPTPSHSYATAGTYNVTLTVVDNDGLSDSDSTSASITDPSSIPPGDEEEEEDDDDEEHRNRGDRDRDAYNRNRNRDERFWRYRRDRD
jgi:PKD repeat protein